MKIKKPEKNGCGRPSETRCPVSLWDYSLVVALPSGLQVAFPLAYCREIIPLPLIDPLPFSWPGLLGVFQHRGLVVPLLDLQTCLQLESPRSWPDPGGSKNLAVILHGQGHAFAFKVSKTLGILSSQGKRRYRVGKNSPFGKVPWIVGFFRHRKQQIYLMDWECFLQHYLAETTGMRKAG